MFCEGEDDSLYILNRVQPPILVGVAGVCGRERPRSYQFPDVSTAIMASPELGGLLHLTALVSVRGAGLSRGKWPHT